MSKKTGFDFGAITEAPEIGTQLFMIRWGSILEKPDFDITSFTYQGPMGFFSDYMKAGELFLTKQQCSDWLECFNQQLADAVTGIYKYLLETNGEMIFPDND